MSETRSLAEALAASPAAALLRRIESSRKLAAAMAAAPVALPPAFDPMRPGCCELRDGVLILTAASSAESSKLRQVLPGLQRTLQQQGHQVNEITVRVQPARTSYTNDGKHFDIAARGAASQDAPQEDGHLADTALPVLSFAQKLALTLPDSSLGRAATALAIALKRRITNNR